MIVGVEHVPATGPTIVAFNHVSALDGPVLAIELSRANRRATRFLVAAEFFRKTVLRMGVAHVRADPDPPRAG